MVYSKFCFDMITPVSDIKNKFLCRLTQTSYLVKDFDLLHSFRFPAICESDFVKSVTGNGQKRVLIKLTKWGGTVIELAVRLQHPNW